jgi:hypothetical protein
LQVFVSTMRWADSLPFDKRPWIFPDIFCPVLYDDWAAGRDVALDAALRDDTVDAPDDDRFAAYWERESQAGAWEPFWR